MVQDMDPGAAAGGQMAGPVPTPGTDMTGIQFRDQLWLNSFPLDRELVFDYFALSPFYDRTCSNEQLRMRAIHPLDPPSLKCVLLYRSVYQYRACFLPSSLLLSSFLSHTLNNWPHLSMSQCLTEIVISSIWIAPKISHLWKKSMCCLWQQQEQMCPFVLNRIDFWKLNPADT